MIIILSSLDGDGRAPLQPQESSAVLVHDLRDRPRQTLESSRAAPARTGPSAREMLGNMRTSTIHSGSFDNECASRSQTQISILSSIADGTQDGDARSQDPADVSLPDRADSLLSL